MRRPLLTLLLSALPVRLWSRSQACKREPGRQWAQNTKTGMAGHVPELGADSPQISILRVDPVTQATQLLIRVPKQMHARCLAQRQ